MSNQHLTYEERSTIAVLKRKNRSNTEIAALTDRHRTTIWRELKRNSNPLIARSQENRTEQNLATTEGGE